MTVTTRMHWERSSSHTVEIDGHPVHYHDVGAGPPLVMPQAFGPLPGTTAWLTYHRTLGELAARHRCILVDYPNFGRSGPREFHEPVHDLYVRNTLGILDRLGLDTITALGVSTGGTVAIGLALAAPGRVERLIVGGCTASTGGDPYLLATGKFTLKDGKVLETGRYLKYPSGTPHNCMLTTVGRLMGLDINEFGDSKYSKGPLPGIV